MNEWINKTNEINKWLNKRIFKRSLRKYKIPYIVSFTEYSIEFPCALYLHFPDDVKDGQYYQEEWNTNTTVCVGQ